MLPSASDKANLFAENFLNYSNLDDLGISLPAFSSRTNLKLHNISVTSKMVKKVAMNLDLPKASDPDCIQVVILKNCELELSYWLISVLRSLVFQIVGRFHQWVSSAVSVSKNVEERYDGIVDHQGKCCLFSDSQYGFRPS